MSVKLRERKEFGNSPITSDNEEESLMGKLLGQMSTVQGGSMLNLLDNGHQEVIDLTIHQAAREGKLYSEQIKQTLELSCNKKKAITFSLSV